MTRIERWFLRRLLKREVMQNYDHDKKIEALYAEIHKACREEFTEDPAPVLDAFLRERFESTQYERRDLQQSE